MEKVMNFEDKDIKIIKLKSYTDYLIDGEIVSVGCGGKEVEVKDIDNIRIVNLKTIIKHYTDGENILSVDEYISKSEALKKNRKYDEYEEEYIWDSLEDEFNYRKFDLKWNKVEETIQTISEPIKVEIITTKYDTGNKFIKNAFLVGSGAATLFEYDRPNAVKDIVAECFKELGMEFKKDINYSSTASKKVWGNSNHSCIEFVTAFGSYVFDKSWHISCVKRGSLEECIQYYNEDKRQLENIIKRRYKNHFSFVDQGKFNFKKLLSNLKLIENRINILEVKKNSQDNHSGLIKDINSVVKMIEESFEVK